MIRTDDISLCCGCGTCVQVCPVHCIHMVKDEFGFSRTQLDAGKCVSCSACEAVCPVQSYSIEEDYEHTAFAAFAKKQDVRFSGSSGGMFGLFANHMLQNGGIVFGAAFDDRLRLHCTSATTAEELKPLMKSKYLQSDLGDAFPQIKRLLDSGKKVLFTASPCQVMALRFYLKRPYENLLTVDFLCHGVPSQSFFDKCLEFSEQQKGIKIKDFMFRAKKKHGATPHYFSVRYEKNGREHKKTLLYTKSLFYLGFQKYITLRDSCYACPFSGSNRCSDITIGDFHAIDSYVKGINRFDGVSTVVINTQKGMAAWDAVSGLAEVFPVDFRRLLDNGELMSGPTKKPADREAFLRDLRDEPFETVVGRYLNTKKEWKKGIYYSMPRPVRKCLKKVMGI